jgi:hypothetical protein
MRRQCIPAGQTPPAKRQITRPCSDCPMARSALNGWLGGSTPEEYAALAHTDERPECHVHGNVECAGMAIYRANICKSPRTPGLTLPADRAAVFASQSEFLAHHKAPLLAEDRAQEPST